jgi:carbonic anhydrase/acetyltransferase-like protein (isoleucine patch superfamily)
MVRKYELTNETVEVGGVKLYRIRAIRDIEGTSFKEGTLGGFIESEKNLSHDGKCWIYGDAKVFGNAVVSENAHVDGNAQVCGNAQISGDSHIYGKALIDAAAVVSGYSFVYGNAHVTCEAQILGRAKVKNIKSKTGEGDMSVVIMPSGARIYDKAEVTGRAIVRDYALVHGDVKLGGDARVYGDAELTCGDCQLNGDMLSEIEKFILASVGERHTNGVYTFYKKVYKSGAGEYRSGYDRKFMYRDGQVAVADDADEDALQQCGKGLHVSTKSSKHFTSGDTLIAVEVAVDDVIACLNGSLRVRKLKVIGEVA